MKVLRGDGMLNQLAASFMTGVFGLFAGLFCFQPGSDSFPWLLRLARMSGCLVEYRTVRNSFSKQPGP